MIPPRYDPVLSKTRDILIICYNSEFYLIKKCTIEMFSLDYKCCTETESKWFGAFVCSRIFCHLPLTGKAVKLLIIPDFAILSSGSLAVQN